MPSDHVEPVDRCCQNHDTWTTLSHHLVTEFSELTDRDVIREIYRAREAVELAALEEDAIFIAELIARYQLLMSAGQLPDAARLDPERHTRRQQPVD